MQPIATDPIALPCRHCGSKDYFTTDAHFGGHASSILRLGFWSAANARVRICGTCGLVDWFLTKDSLQIVREDLEKGGRFTADAPPEPEQELPDPYAPGFIEIEDDSLVYRIAGGEGWRVPIAELRVIGEYTDESGLGAGNSFLTFLTATDFYEASSSSEGLDAVLVQLGQRLGHLLVTGLTHSTSLASRILWPARLEGQPVFDFVPEMPATNVPWHLGQQYPPKVERRLTDQLLEELEVR